VFHVGYESHFSGFSIRTNCLVDEYFTHQTLNHYRTSEEVRLNQDVGVRLYVLAKRTLSDGGCVCESVCV